MRVLARFHGANLPAQHQRPFPRLQQPRHPFGHLHLVIPIEKMKERAGVDDVDLAVQLFQGRLRVKDIGAQERGLQPLLVEEQVVAEVDKLGAEVGAPEVLGRGTVGDEFADVLTETAAQVEQGFAVFDAPEDVGVEGRLTDAEVEEVEPADARIRPDIPRPFSLHGRRRKDMISRICYDSVTMHPRRLFLPYQLYNMRDHLVRGDPAVLFENLARRRLDILQLGIVPWDVPIAGADLRVGSCRSHCK